MLRVALCLALAMAGAPLAASAAAPTAADPSAVGEWSGALHRGDSAYRVRFHVQTDRRGGLTGTVSGLTGGASPAALTRVEKSGDRLIIDTAEGEYSGVWDGAAWIGSWKQADMTLPLSLRWDGDNAMPRLRASPSPIVPVLPAYPLNPAP